MKYMGSKAKIADEIIPIMTDGRKDYQCFVDLFCGGCNLLDKVDGPRIANDRNPYLIAMWDVLTRDGDWMFPKRIEKPLYDKWRDYFNRTKKTVGPYSETKAYRPDWENLAMSGWVGFMGSFNGRFYDGGYSGHKVPVSGKTRDYIAEQINNTLRQLDKLKGVDFYYGDYSDICGVLPSESIIYCDIPYKDTKQYAYSKDFDYGKFYRFCREMKDKGHTVFVSEYWMPDDFECIWEKEVTNALNPRITKKPTERLYKVR